MIFKIQIYTLRISEYYRESIEMKLTKRQFNISISLFILSLPLNYQNFLSTFLVYIFFGVGEVDVSQGYRLFWKIRASLTMIAMMWILHSQLLYSRDPIPPPLLNKNLNRG